jgi:hypothetical protein
MTLATVQRTQLSGAVQSLIDNRLDTIDRMLVGRVARAERMAIVREVESQIHELLNERETDALSREDVLSVLARLDPPEAYLPEEDRPINLAPATAGLIRSTARPIDSGNIRVARASAMLGLAGVASAITVLPCAYMIASLFDAAVLGFGLVVATILVMFVSGVLSIALGRFARKSGALALVGIVSGALSVAFALFLVIGAILFG